MSEFTERFQKRVDKLETYLEGVMQGRNGLELIRDLHILETRFEPMDALMALDKVMERDVDMEKLKVASNKLFNLLFKEYSGRPQPDYSRAPILQYLREDNRGCRENIQHIKQWVKQMNSASAYKPYGELLSAYEEFLLYTEHYRVMQNIIFPELERQVEQHRCLSLMWSFHDDIMGNIKHIIQELKKTPVDLNRFNYLTGKIFFNVNTIMFREEYVLFPILMDVLDESRFAIMQSQLPEFKLRYVEFSDDINVKSSAGPLYGDKKITLSTGELTVAQLESLFKTLPVDITFVDENDEVRFFSDPPHRIFPRTTGVLGRKVHNCHPRESVHVVERIVESFKKGEKNHAAFWIHPGEKYVLIQYFAVRNDQGTYQGVLEVSQEISEIRQIKGEKKLLEW